MLEIRFHGRGGQGALIAARILASAFAKEGKDVLVVPEFGSERRSAPVVVGLRVDENKILLRSKIYTPDITVILDKSFPGISEIARKYKLGPSSLPAVGTAMLGAFAKATGLVKLESILEAAQESDELPKKEANLQAIKEAFDITEKGAKLEAKPEESQALIRGRQALPISVVSLGDTRANKTGTWRKIKPEYSLPKDTISTCMVACPIHQNIRQWLLLIKGKNIDGALKELLTMNPLPSSVSRVCPKFCEKGCQNLRQGFDESIAISAVEKYLGDLAIKKGFSLALPEINKNQRAAVLGSGPAGLTCAYLLRRLGYSVTVFEKEEKLGGLLRYGIPGDKLPKEILDKELMLHFQGIEFQTGTEINRDNFSVLKKDFQTIFLAAGFNESRRLDIQGEDFSEVIPGLLFLKTMLTGPKTYPLNQNIEDIVIIGGGNTAMDAARVAKLSLAKRVRVFHRRDKFRARPEESQALKDLGVELCFSTVVKRISRNSLRLPRLALLLEDLSTGKIYHDQTNLVVAAVGQQKSVIWDEFAAENVFAVGDLLSDPKTVAHAIGSANTAVRKITAPRGKIRTRVARDDINFAYFKPKPRMKDITREANRCFSCGICDLCGNCWIFCPDMAISETKEGLKINYDFCKGCQICLNECPRGVISTSTWLSASISTRLSAREAKNA